jgi:hypothetical protein
VVRIDDVVPLLEVADRGLDLEVDVYPLFNYLL